MTAETAELDVRINILNSVLRSPHRDVTALVPTHSQALKGDPLFYLHFAAWYTDKGEVRDHKHLFVARLLTSDPSLRFRPVGRTMLTALAPFEAERSARYAKEQFKGATRFLRDSVARYLFELESSDKRFDGAATRSRNSLRSLYASFHIKPSKRAQSILFEGEPPEGSQTWVVRQLSKVSPQEAARLIADHRIPLPVAVGAVKVTTPAIWVALLLNATPQEVINSLQSLEKRGLLADPEVKEIVGKKLQEAEKDKRVSTLKGSRAAEKVQDETIRKAMEKTVDTRLQNKVAITRSTLLLVDRSGSMESAIVVARELAALIAPLCQGGLWVYAFNDTAMKVEAKDQTRKGWEEAFRYVAANGWTSIGCGLRKALDDGARPEQIILVSDGNENRAPRLVDVHREHPVDITFVRVGLCGHLSPGLPVTEWDFSGDFYSLPNLLPLLAKPSAAQMVEEIMAYPVLGWSR